MKSRFLLQNMIIVLSCISPFVSMAQTPWNTEGNSNTGDTSFIGTKDYNDLIFKTDSVTRITITKDGEVNINDLLVVPSLGGEGNQININGSLSVTGSVKTDSLISNSGDFKLKSNLNMPDKWLLVDSIRARTIHVGDSSIVIGFTGLAYCLRSVRYSG